MLNIRYIQENKEKVIESLTVRNFDATQIVEQMLATDEKRRQTQNALDNNLAEGKQLAKQIGMLFKTGKTHEANQAKAQTATLKENAKMLATELAKHEEHLKTLSVQIPNLPHASVPKGKAETDNQEVRTGGTMPDLGNNALPHWEIAQKFDIIDFELGNKITGAGFPFYKGKGAQLQRALINFFLDRARQAGYTEYMPPLLINEESGYATGQLPDKEGQMYQLKNDNFYLIPTAEIPITNIFRDVIIDANKLPVKCTAYTPCFRREAGSYGKDVRGLNRLHQFDKVEIVQIAHPDKSYETLEKMVAHVEKLVKDLELPYRILRLCGGDLGFTSALTFDFEVYSGAQKRWLEVSSVSNFESFQANRLKLRYREADKKKPQIAHTLNGSALALPRIVAALLENNQTPEGIRIPEILVPYTGFDLI